MTGSTEALVGDRYELGERLGSGGMADVHRATDRVLHREVAVKILRDTADTETDRARFTAEARTLAGLSHPHLVTVLDAGTTTDRPFLVMELVEGPTLSERAASGPLPATEVATVGAQVADALAYAHRQGVVHRDVKPANVLLGEGASARVKLADFGIARLIGDTVRHTRTGTAVGTAAYLAPEQVRGEELTTAADVYSLGLVLLEVLTGERAYPGTPTESAMARLTRPPHVPADLPAGWADLLTSMTAADPAGRPDAAAVAERLGPLADGAGTTLVLDTHPTVRRLPAVPPAAATAPRWDAWAARVREVPPHVRGVALAVAALLLLILVAGLASVEGSSGDEPGATVPEVPADVPADLRAPLERLHDAVAGVEQ